jgi:hypothetical protein
LNFTGGFVAVFFFFFFDKQLVLINQLGLAWSTGKHIKFKDGTTVPTSGIPGKSMEEYP